MIFIFLFWQKPVILDYLASKTISFDDLVVVSPDVGGVARARAFAKKLSDAPLAIVDKRRHGHNIAEVIFEQCPCYQLCNTTVFSRLVYARKKSSTFLLVKYSIFFRVFNTVSPLISTFYARSVY